MQYELYIDIFFVVNFIMDLLLVLIVKKVLRLKSSVLRMTVAAALGAVGICIFILLPVRNHLLVQLAWYVGMYVAMTFVGFGRQGRRAFIKCLIYMYGISYLISGIYVQCANRIRHFHLLCISAVGIYMLYSGGICIYRRLYFKQEFICPVTLEIHQKTWKFQGLWDTGNRLQTPYTGKGITVIGYEDIQQCLSDPIKEQIRQIHLFEQTNKNSSLESQSDSCGNWEYNTSVKMIPYRTVGKSLGFLPVIEADKLYVERQGAVLEFVRPLLGIAENQVCSSGRYQMILTTDGTCG